MKRSAAIYWAVMLGLFCLAGMSQAQQPKEEIPAPKEQPKELPEVPVPGTRITGAEQQPETDPGRGIPWSDTSRVPTDATRVGPYNQPAWTTQRPFTAVRTYVIPDGTMELEQWYRPRWHRDGSREDRILEEWAIGLPYHLQLDVYERWNIKPNDDNHYEANHEGVMIELRWALADWDVIPLNPTIYAEWVQRGNTRDEPDKYELKLLLADSYFNDSIYYAGNFIIEKEVGGEKENELAYSQAIATTLIERKLLAGVETWYRAQNVHDARGTWNNELLVGPAIQWRPTNRTFLDVSALFGTTKGSPDVEMYVIFGFQFGKRAGPSFGGITPTALGQ